ncbi:hypothetical protein [Escherichia phage vB_EcoM-720R8]|nr:hypothetical protein [Escherichia phage vB_EcoM-720R8]
MGATIFCCAEHETLFDLAGQWMKQQIQKSGQFARQSFHGDVFILKSPAM